MMSAAEIRAGTGMTDVDGGMHAWFTFHFGLRGVEGSAELDGVGGM